MNFMSEFLKGNGAAVYAVIFFGKILEVSLDTVRIVLISKGKRTIGALLGFVTVMIWLVIVSSVISDLTANPLKALIYATAYALGNFIGVTIEEKLAIGLHSVQVIVHEDAGLGLAETLREKGFGVTVLRGEAKDHGRSILVIHLLRKNTNEAVKIIKEKAADAVITISDTRVLQGGFLRKAGKRL